MKVFITAFLMQSALASPVIESGKQEIWQGMRDARPVWTVDAFENLPSVWGIKLTSKSEAFRLEFQKRYGLFFDPDFANDGFPVGLTQTRSPRGITVSCQACHTAQMNGKMWDGISNPFFDYQRLNQDMRKAGGDASIPFFESNPDRNSMVSYSNYMGRLGIFVRPIFPAIDLYRLYAVFADPNAGNILVQPLKKELPFRELIKPQPWVGFRYKEQAGRGLYVDGGYMGSASAAHYALHFTLDPAGTDFVNAVQRFEKVGPVYLSSLEAPRYPGPINPEKSRRGQAIYDQKCAKCHGGFEQRTLKDYPGKLADRDVLKTDPLRIDYKIQYDNEMPDWVKKTYKKTYKYISPPLNGIWARAPYLHNGSVPTLAQLLDSRSRAKKFALQPDFRFNENYDQTNLGWKTIDLSEKSQEEIARLKRVDPYLRIYDPEGHIGMSNSGHTFGDQLSPTERSELLEYLKRI